MNFEFSTATRIVFGAGSARHVGEHASHFARHALVVTGSNSQRAGRLLSNLAENNIGAALFAVTGEPEISTVEAGVALAKKADCDCVISYGGGSVIDAGKAIAAMMTNDGPLLKYLEVIGAGEALKKRPAPFVAVPTTARGPKSRATPCSPRRKTK